MIQRAVTQEDVAEKALVQKKAPTESDFKGKRGYWKRPRLVLDESGKDVRDPSGAYDWGFKYRPNNGAGKLTRAGAEVQEMMLPFQRADTERHAKLQARIERTALKDSNGQTHFVDAALADETARRNGWGHRWRAGGVSVERGIDGMLFRLVRGEWEALGVRCLGTPLVGSANVSRRGIQRDPDGVPWRFVGGEWRQL